jgi:hypothetical protein
LVIFLVIRCSSILCICPKIKSCINLKNVMKNQGND